MPDRISAFTIVSVPAIVTGADAAASGIEQIPTGMPASAKTRIASTGPVVPVQRADRALEVRQDRAGAEAPPRRRRRRAPSRRCRAR